LTVTETQDGARRWPRIWAVFLTGVAAAFLVGKAPAALPILREELDLSLFQAGLVVSMFSLVAALTGCFFGALSDRFGQLRLAIIGLVTASAAGAWGALVHSGEWLIVTRVAEGIGFFMMSVSLPGLIIRLADERTRQTAMGLWGAYLPLGAGLVLLAGGVVISTLGWRGLWLAISATYVLCLAALVWAAPAHRQTNSPAGAGRIASVLKTPGAVMLAVVFGCYSGQYMAVTSFVPLILVERAGWALAPAAAAGAAVMVANTAGNVASGFLLDRGWQRRTLIVLAATMMAAGAVVVMAGQLACSRAHSRCGRVLRFRRHDPGLAVCRCCAPQPQPRSCLHRQRADAARRRHRPACRPGSDNRAGWPGWRTVDLVAVLPAAHGLADGAGRHRTGADGTRPSAVSGSGVRGKARFKQRQDFVEMVHHVIGIERRYVGVCIAEAYRDDRHLCGLGRAYVGR
jgi:MFS family permease